MRQVLVISGKDNFHPLSNQPAMDAPALLNKLSKQDNIKFVSVGDGSHDIALEDIENVLSQMDKDSPLTIIMQCHGTNKGGQFNFVLGKNNKVSSKDLFTLITHRFGESVDLFTPACYGGAMLNDTNLLPQGSVAISLTGEGMVNSASDYQKMVSELDKFNQDFSAYNLLQFFMLNYLRNRFEPQIAISGGKTINLNQELVDFCTSQSRPNIEPDATLLQKINDPAKYTSIISKLAIVKNDWQIYASEYGTALGIMLNEIEKKHQLFNDTHQSTMETN